MTLPTNCDWCGQVLTPWDPDENTPCRGCGNIVPTWENLSPSQRRLRIALIARRDAQAIPVEVRKDVL